MFKFKPLVAAILTVATAQAFAAENTSEQNQLGINNNAEVLQSGGAGNLATQNQSGFANDALAEQSSAPRWNFYKYVVGRDGKVIASFSSLTKPDDPELIAAVEKAIASQP